MTETRCQLHADLQVVRAAGGVTLTGCALRYGTPSESLGGWVEVFAPGACARYLGSPGDVLALHNGDPARLLGRRRAGSLRLDNSDEQLLFTVDVNPGDPAALAVAAQAERGDLEASTVTFAVAKDAWDVTTRGYPVRRILEIARIISVGPTAIPAIPDDAAQAALELLGAEKGLIIEDLERALVGGWLPQHLEDPKPRMRPELEAAYQRLHQFADN